MSLVGVKYLSSLFRIKTASGFSWSSCWKGFLSHVSIKFIAHVYFSHILLDASDINPKAIPTTLMPYDRLLAVVGCTPLFFFIHYLICKIFLYMTMNIQVEFSPQWHIYWLTFLLFLYLLAKLSLMGSIAFFPRYFLGGFIHNKTPLSSCSIRFDFSSEVVSCKCLFSWWNPEIIALWLWSAPSHAAALPSNKRVSSYWFIWAVELLWTLSW